MRLLLRAMTLLTILLCAAAPAAAATSSEFYLNLLNRGIGAFEGERYADATGYLKLAAFGLVDSIENYQTAQVYLTLTYERLNDPVKARDAARRVVFAERIQRKFATIALPANVAKSFDGAVTRLLGNADAAYLRNPPQTATPPMQQPRPQPPAVEPRPQQATIPPPAATRNSQSPAVTEKTPAPAPTTAGTNPIQADPPKKPIVDKPINQKPPVKAPATTEKPAPANGATNGAPRAGSSETSARPIVPPPAPQTSAPAQISTPTPRPLSSQEAASRLATGERALSTGQLAEARRTYRSLLDAVGVARDILIRAAEGLYRARDFEGTLAGFAKAGALRRGEEPYHYYLAVAYYETGQIARAKAELSAAMPFIEITPDVARYRARIDDAVD